MKLVVARSDDLRKDGHGDLLRYVRANRMGAHNQSSCASLSFSSRSRRALTAERTDVERRTVQRYPQRWVVQLGVSTTTAVWDVSNSAFSAPLGCATMI